MNINKFWAILGLTLLTLPLHAANTSVAMLTGLTGNVSANGKPISLFSELKADTELTLNDKTQATLVLFNKGQEFVLNGPLKAHIKTDAIEVNGQSLPGKTLLPDSSNLKLAVQNFEQAATVMRGDLESVELIYPLQGRIFERHPTLQWEAPGPGYHYQIELLTQQGETLFTGKTNKPELKLPDNVNLPINQIIIWEVEATKDTESLSNQASFILASQSLIDQLNQQKPDSKASPSVIALYMKLLEDLKFTQEAKKYRALLKHTK